MPPADQADCIVLTDRGADDLRAALRARGWTDRLESDPHLALAALCRLDRARRSNAAFLGLQPSSPAAVVIDQDVTIDGADDMVAVVRRYLPRIDVWRWNTNQLVRDGEGRAEPRPRSPRPGLRLTEGTPWPTDDTDDDDDDPSTLSSELTREEIEMLLALDEPAS